METVPIKKRFGMYCIYDDTGELVGKVNEETGRAIIGNSFWDRRNACRNKDRSDRSFFCSECGYQAWTYGDSYCDPSDFCFCPNCGADVEYNWCVYSE